jgi:hypothetical protein
MIQVLDGKPSTNLAYSYQKVTFYGKITPIWWERIHERRIGEVHLGRCDLETVRRVNQTGIPYGVSIYEESIDRLYTYYMWLQVASICLYIQRLLDSR